MKVLLYLIMMTLSLNLNAQIEKISFNKYRYESVNYNKFELKSIMSLNEDANNEYEEFIKNRSRARKAIAYSGLCIVGTVASFVVLPAFGDCGDSPCYSSAAVVSGSFLIVSTGLLFKSLYSNKKSDLNLKNAIKLFNDDQLDLSNAIKWKINVGIQDHGIGLCLQF